MEPVNFLVRVACITFNHASYIEDAMNGFTMQETKFPFVCTIVDDASTDGEQEVIEDYLKEHFDLEDKAIVRQEETDDYVRTVARHKSNHNCYFVVLLLKYNHYSIKKSQIQYLHEWLVPKSVAICEGDDYWIDPLKLQKQVDFLEMNPSYSMIYTKYKEDHNGTIKNGSWNLLEGNCIKSYLLREGYIPTASVMYRSNFKFDYDYRKMNLPLGDAPLWIQLMHDSPIKLLPDFTTTYRILDESASHSRKYINRLIFDTGALRCRKFFADKYGYIDVSRLLEKEIKRNSLIMEFYNGNYKSFISSKPWIYGIGLKVVFAVLLEKHYDKNIK